MKTILVIECTSKIVTRLIQAQLENITVEHHKNTDLALKRIIENHFDLIIIDADIKCCGDMDITKLLRAAAISGKPVIVMSTLGNIWNFIKIGLNYFNNKINENIRYLINPFNKTLKHTISEMINIAPIDSNIMFNRLMKPMNGKQPSV